MFSAHLHQYAQEKFNERLPFFGMVKEEILQSLSRCSKDEQILMKFLYGTMPLSDAGEYPFSLFLSFVSHSLMVYQNLEWCRSVPEEIFLHYILYYRINSESIEDCRRFFYDQLISRIQGLSVKDAVLEINYWCAQNGTYESTDDRTMSPMTLYRCGKGRCGEESTFAVTAFRSAGIPARQVYTPWWAHCDDNHAWVEVYADGKWHFLGACEPEEILDKGWFSSASSRALMIHARTFSDYPGYSAPGASPECLYGRSSSPVAGEQEGFWSRSGSHKPGSSPIAGEQEDFLENDGLMACYNRTSGYAKTKFFQILVKDKCQLPVKHAKVQILILNMARYNEAATLYTDESGTARITLGLGSIRILAEKDGFWAQSTCSVKDTDKACLVLRQMPAKNLEEHPSESLAEIITGQPAENWMDTDMEAPKDALIHPANLTPAQKEQNQARLTLCRQLRRQRIQGYYQESLALQYPEEKEILKEAGGNFDEIYRFLSKDHHPARRELLHSLAVKDYKDAKARILESHLASSLPFREKWEAKGQLKIYTDYILCPRIYLEPLSDYKSFIREYFRFDEISPEGMEEPMGKNSEETANHSGKNQETSLKARFLADPKAIWDYILSHIRYEPALNYQILCSTPAACLRLSHGSLLSQKILFAAVCRTLGIPARLNPVDLEAEYWTDISPKDAHKSDDKRFYGRGTWVTVSKGSEKNCEEKTGEYKIPRPQRQNGQVTLTAKAGDTWNYHQTWTIGRLEKGGIFTLDYDGTAFLKNRLTLSLTPGIYRIITANRLPNGNQLASEYWFSIAAGEAKEIPMRLRAGKPEEMLTENDLEDFDVTEDGKACQAASLLRDSANILAFLQEGQEPTEHVLNELYRQAQQLEQLPIQLFFILQDPEALTNQTIQKVLKRLPKIRILYGRFDRIAEPLARRMYVEPDKFPLLILTKPGMKGIYGCSGYHVGSVDLMIRLLGTFIP